MYHPMYTVRELWDAGYITRALTFGLCVVYGCSFYGITSILLSVYTR
jgi:hypothetical protein